MKIYVHASSDKPKLDFIDTVWQEFEDGSGIKFTIYSKSGDVLFEEVFDYSDVDSDAIYDSAIDMARAVLSQKFDIQDSLFDDVTYPQM